MPKSKYKQRKDGRYATTFKGQTIYAKSSKELDNKISELNYLSNTGMSFGDNNITFQKFAEQWIELKKKLQPSKSHSRQEGLLKNYIYPKIGFIQLKNLKKSNIQQIQADMIQKNLTEQTNKALNLVKTILNSAIDDNIILKNPAFNIKGYTFQKEERKPLTSIEDNLLLQTAQTHKYGLFFLLLRYCGLRPEEVRALTIDNINLKEKIITINSAYSFVKSNKGEKKDTKNYVHREVPIPDLIFPNVQKEINKSKSIHTNLLFYKQTNPIEYMSQSCYKSCVNSFLYQLNNLYAGNNKISFTPYQLRHSYCTMLYYSGISLKESQRLMGHKSSKMVLEIYTHLIKENENTTEKLNNFISLNIK